jgi:hypothetical protein
MLLQWIRTWSRRNYHISLDCHRKNKAIVVVDVLANQIDTAGSRSHDRWHATESRLVFIFHTLAQLHELISGGQRSWMG